ncbi:MAG: hypothetical protein JRL30_01210 [Deltaproteobacteria bacterium]|nr:hypothetical protein [Deltaproteobacteria bacterium]
MTATTVPGLKDPLKFMMAGKAIFTILNSSNGHRFTFKVTKAKDATARGPWFVKVLTGPDNGAHYKYLGCVWVSPSRYPKIRTYSHGRKSKIADDASSVRAFRWILARLQKEEPMPVNVQVFHEGRCGRCGRRLTVPESIESGYGPECIKLMGGK